VQVPGKQVPHFKAGKELRIRVDLESYEAYSMETGLPGLGFQAML
jgi:integration host factor subunit beta